MKHLNMKIQKGFRLKKNSQNSVSFLTISNRGAAPVSPPDYRLIGFKVVYVAGLIKGIFFLRIINLGMVRINMNKNEY